MNSKHPKFVPPTVPALVSLTIWLASACPSIAAEKSTLQSAPSFASKSIVVPKIWDDQALATWVLLVAGLNVAGHHVSEREYYAVPIDNLRTYPVYHPDREPKGYQEWLKQQPPKPLIEPEKLKTERDCLSVVADNKTTTPNRKARVQVGS